MSWQVYVDSAMAQSKDVEYCGIYGQEQGETWASNCNVTRNDILAIMDEMKKDPNDREEFRTNGLNILGARFMFQSEQILQSSNKECLNFLEKDTMKAEADKLNLVIALSKKAVFLIVGKGKDFARTPAGMKALDIYVDNLVKYDC